MQHDEPYMDVAPGQSQEMIWTLNRAGGLIAGHYQAGMRGRVEVSGQAGEVETHAH